MHNENDAKAALSIAKLNSVAAANKSTLTIDKDNAISNMTARRATIEMAMSTSEYKLTDINPIDKDASRFVNENSPRNGMAQTFVTANAQFIIMPGESSPFPKPFEKFDPTKISAGAN